MKAILNWLGDPFVHLIVVLLVIIRFTWGMGGETNAAEAGAQCDRCKSAHAASSRCPTPAATPWYETR